MRTRTLGHPMPSCRSALFFCFVLIGCFLCESWRGEERQSDARYILLCLSLDLTIVHSLWNPKTWHLKLCYSELKTIKEFPNFTLSQCPFKDATNTTSFLEKLELGKIFPSFFFRNLRWSASCCDNKRRVNLTALSDGLVPIPILAYYT